MCEYAVDQILQEANYVKSYDFANITQEGEYSRGVWIDVKVSVDNWDAIETETEMVFLSKPKGGFWRIDQCVV